VLDQEDRFDRVGGGHHPTVEPTPSLS
jgi:hypothetical protein